MPRWHCQTPVYFGLDIVLKLATVNTSIMIFYTGLSIPVEGGKIVGKGHGLYRKLQSYNFVECDFFKDSYPRTGLTCTECCVFLLGQE